MIEKNPKIFISHAGEDRERFVKRFATILRDNGVDAWVSFWEINDGDSLAEKIFDEGIGESSHFIIILSQYSINKPWVKKELSIAVVKQIEEKYKIIPILIDDVEIPTNLKDTRYRRIKKLNDFDSEVKEIIDSILGLYKKPTIGNLPSYIYAKDTVQLPNISLIDNIVINICFDILKDWEQRPFIISLKDLMDATKKMDLSENDVFNSLQFLKENFYLKGEFANSEGRKILYNPHFTTWGFQQVAKLKIIDFSIIVSNYATYIYNELSNNRYLKLSSIHLAEKFSVPVSYSRYIIKILEEKCFCEITETTGGIFIKNITPTLKRWIESR